MTLPGEAPHASGAATPQRPPIASLILALAILLVGLAVVFAVAGREERRQDETPWGRALVLVQDESPQAGSQPILMRRLQQDEIPPRSLLERQVLIEFEKSPDGHQLIDSLGLERHEFLFLLDMASDRWPELLESGRLPEPGQAEALAGAITRFDRFSLHDTEVEVVGRLRSNIPGLAFSYVMPDHPDIRTRAAENGDLDRAWLVPGGLDPAAAKELRLQSADDGETAPAAVNPVAPTRRDWAVAAIGGLALMAFGGALFQVRLLQWWGRGRLGRALPVLVDLNRWPAVLWLLHIGYYGLFLGAMVVALYFPLANLRLMGMIQNQLYRDQLSFIGEAYLSGNILKAAFMTFAWNYGYATLLLVILPATLIPFLGTLFGLGKTALSFTLVGFGLSPMWIGSASDYTFHSITMVLELEAYVIAAFVIVAVLFNMVLGISRWEVRSIARAFYVSMSGAVVVAAMLAIAALYEATTLILFRFAA